MLSTSSSSYDVDQIRFLLTDTCNANCSGCHNEGQSITGARMSLDWLSNFMSLISPLSIREIVLSGGEPLLHPDLEDIIHIIRSHSNCFLSINTNGLVSNRLLSIYPLVDEVKLHVESSSPSEYFDLMKLDFSRLQSLLSSLPDYSKLIFCCILRSESQALNLISFASSFPGSMVKFNELTVSPPYSISSLESLLSNLNYSISSRIGSHVKLISPQGVKVSLRQCIGTPPYIDAHHRLHRGLYGIPIDLVPLVSQSNFNHLSFLLSSSQEIEYRWCISQSTFSLLNSSLNLQNSFQYQMDRVFILNDSFPPDERYFRIKDRGGSLSFDIKGRSSSSQMYYEQSLSSLSSLEDALLFASLYTRPNLSLEKFRASSSHPSLGHSTLHLDRVIDLGYFIELEGPDALSVSSLLGLASYPQALPYGEYLQKGISPTPIDISSSSLSLLSSFSPYPLSQK